MRKPDLHPIDCDGAACTPVSIHSGDEALAIATATLVLVVIVLIAVWAGLQLESLYKWS